MANIKTINLKPRGEKGDMKSSPAAITISDNTNYNRPGIEPASSDKHKVKTKGGYQTDDPKWLLKGTPKYL